MHKLALKSKKTRFFSLLRKNVLFLFIGLLCLFSSCKFTWYGNFKNAIDESTKCKVSFYEEDPATNPSAAKVSHYYEIGASYSKNSFTAESKSELYHLKPGYDPSNITYLWNTIDYDTALPSVIRTDLAGYIESLEVPLEPFAVFVVWTAGTNTPYKVYHMYQNANDDNYTLYKITTQYGITDTLSAATAISFPHSLADSTDDVNIAGDGSSIAYIRYIREQMPVTIAYNFGGVTDEYLTLRYGQSFNPVLPSISGYSIVGWTATYSDSTTEELSRLPEIITVSATYTARWKKQTGGADGVADIDFVEVALALDKTSATEGVEETITVSATSNGSPVYCSGWTMALYDAWYGDTGIGSSDNTMSTSSIFTLPDTLAAGTYYLYIKATPKILINGSYETKPAVTKYIMVTVN